MFGEKLKEELYALRGESASLKATVMTLQTELTASREQVIALTNAMVAQTSPGVYQDMRMDSIAEEDVPNEMREKDKLRNEVHTEWFNRLEKPAFDNAQDMIDSMTRGLGRNITDGKHTVQVSLHGNDES